MTTRDAAEITDEMISSHEEMISSACSLELTTSTTSDGLSDKENVVRLLRQHVNTSNRFSNTVRPTLQLFSLHSTGSCISKQLDQLNVTPAILSRYFILQRNRSVTWRSVSRNFSTVAQLLFRIE